MGDVIISQDLGYCSLNDESNFQIPEEPDCQEQSCYTLSQDTKLPAQESGGWSVLKLLGGLVSQTLIPVAYAAPQVVQGISFPEGTDISLDSSGRLTRAIITADDFVLQGVRFTRDRTKVDFHPNGKIEEINGGSVEVNGIEFPSTATLHFNDDGWLERAYNHFGFEMQGIKGWGHIDFHENGLLKEINALSGTQTIQGITCVEGANVEFYEGGRLKSCGGVGHDYIIDGERFRKGGYATLKDQNHVIVLVAD